MRLLRSVFFYMVKKIRKRWRFAENVIFSVYSRKVVSADVKSVKTRLCMGQNDVPESDGNNFELIGTIFESVKSISSYTLTIS